MSDKEPHLAQLKLKADNLQKAYLPFIKGGGLLVPSIENKFYMGDEIFLKVDVEGKPEPYRIVGKVVWIATHADAKEYERGVGIQFQDQVGKKLNEDIKTMLARMNKAAK